MGSQHFDLLSQNNEIQKTTEILTCYLLCVTYFLINLTKNVEMLLCHEY